MSVLEGKERRIVGFLCNWCSYGGADTAGVGRFNQPTDLRIIRVPCSGRVDPLFVVKALVAGADGVLVSGCHPRDCHYSEGNFYARRRLEVLKQFLPVIGIDPARFHYTWVSASEGQRWKEVVENFTNEIHKLGPAPKFADAKPYWAELNRKEAQKPLKGSNSAVLAELKQAIKAKLQDGSVDVVLGWEQGYNPTQGTPLFMTKPEDVDRLMFGPLSIHNLATYLPPMKNKKVGIVVKGCDSRSVVELLQEELLVRNNVTIFNMGCNGVVDADRLKGRIPVTAHVESFTVEGENCVIRMDGKEETFPFADVAAIKCLQCTVPNAVESDVFVGERAEAANPHALGVPLEALTLEQRMGFWRAHMDRCIRCYACRNACPMCVCKDHCIGESRDPHWTSVGDAVVDKFFYQLIHAVHLAGRCTGCGECQRACPMSIPVGLLKWQMCAVVNELFSYSSGMDSTAVPPLLTYKKEEQNIKEHG